MTGVWEAAVWFVSGAFAAAMAARWGRPAWGALGFLSGFIALRFTDLPAAWIPVLFACLALRWPNGGRCAALAAGAALAAVFLPATDNPAAMPFSIGALCAILTAVWVRLKPSISASLWVEESSLLLLVLSVPVLLVPALHEGWTRASVLAPAVNSADEALVPVWLWIVTGSAALSGVVFSLWRNRP